MSLKRSIIGLPVFAFVTLAMAVLYAGNTAGAAGPSHSPGEDLAKAFAAPPARRG